MGMVAAPPLLLLSARGDVGWGRSNTAVEPVRPRGGGNGPTVSSFPSNELCRSGDGTGGCGVSPEADLVTGAGVLAAVSSGKVACTTEPCRSGDGAAGGTVTAPPDNCRVKASGDLGRVDPPASVEPADPVRSAVSSSSSPLPSNVGYAVGE